MIYRSLALALASLGFASALPSAGQATGLKIAPIIVEVPRAAATTLTIQNVEQRPVDVQIRVFRWTQRDGKDQLEPTRDVVASPPIARIAASGSNVIRLVRLSKEPPKVEESYRLLIDEVPRVEKSQKHRIGFAVRYSIPVFFGTPKTREPGLRWSYVQRNGRTLVTATNAGAKRVRISELTVASPTGGSATFGKGLIGYVLPNSTITWQARSSLPSLPASSPLTVIATTEHGKIRGEAIRKAAQ